MFDVDQDQRTLPPSARRRAAARQSGSVPRSPEAAATLVLIVFTFGLVLAGPTLITAGRELLSRSFTHVSIHSAATDPTDEALAAVTSFRTAAAWLLGAVAAAVAGNVIQFGVLFAPQVVQPDFGRLSPERGLQRISSELQARSLLLQCSRLTAIAVITGCVVWSIWPQVVDPAQSPPEVVGTTFSDAVILLGSCLAGGVLAVSVLMAVAARLRHEAGLGMTAQEARDEQMLNETAPSVVQRRHAVRQQRVSAVSARTAEDHA